MLQQSFHPLFIANQWHTASGPLFSSWDPVTGKPVWKGNSATQTEIEKAFESAKAALPFWSSLSLEKRLHYLETFCALLKTAQDDLAEAISQETGKPLWESKTEVTSMINKLPISVEAYQRRSAEMTHDQLIAKSITRHKPHGIVAVFGPFNFPGHLPNGHIIPALLAGNCVIFKPSEFTPLVAEKIIHCWEKAALPAGVINLVQGGPETGRILAQHPSLNALFFTGSAATGAVLAKQFAATPEKMLALEMGGNNPLVVSKISNYTTAAYLTIQSAYLTAGQRCSCARRLIVPQGSQGDAFIAALIEMIQGIKVGHYTEKSEPFMGPVISTQAADRLLMVQEALIKKGGKPFVKMALLKPETALLSPGLIDVTAIKERSDEEFFGPFLQLIRVSDFHSAIEEANHTVYGLTAGLLSEDPQEYQLFYQNVNAGVINWNTPLTGASSAAPFGGVGKSGNFRPSAYYAADYCAYPVASLEVAMPQLPTQLTPGVSIASFHSNTKKQPSE